jgi:hypothetical protein
MDLTKRAGGRRGVGAPRRRGWMFQPAAADRTAAALEISRKVGQHRRLEHFQSP